MRRPAPSGSLCAIVTTTGPSPSSSISKTASPERTPESSAISPETPNSDASRTTRLAGEPELRGGHAARRDGQRQGLHARVDHHQAERRHDVGRDAVLVAHRLGLGPGLDATAQAGADQRVVQVGDEGVVRRAQQVEEELRDQVRVRVRGALDRVAEVGDESLPQVFDEARAVRQLVADQRQLDAEDLALQNVLQAAQEEVHAVGHEQDVVDQAELGRVEGEEVADGERRAVGVRRRAVRTRGPQRRGIEEARERGPVHVADLQRRVVRADPEQHVVEDGSRRPRGRREVDRQLGVDLSLEAAREALAQVRDDVLDPADPALRPGVGVEVEPGAQDVRAGQHAAGTAAHRQAAALDGGAEGPEHRAQVDVVGGGAEARRDGGVLEEIDVRRAREIDADGQQEAGLAARLQTGLPGQEARVAQVEVQVVGLAEGLAQAERDAKQVDARLRRGARGALGDEARAAAKHEGPIAHVVRVGADAVGAVVRSRPRDDDHLPRREAVVQPAPGRAGDDRCGGSRCPARTRAPAAPRCAARRAVGPRRAPGRDRSRSRPSTGRGC